MLVEAHKPGCPWRVRQTPGESTALSVCGRRGMLRRELRSSFPLNDEPKSYD